MPATGSHVTPALSPLGDRFIYRSESFDHKFFDSAAPEARGGAMIRARHISRPDDLLRPVMVAKGRPFLVDPDTDVLRVAKPSNSEIKGVLAMRSAQVAPLPLVPPALDPQTLQRFVSEAVASQRGAQATIAPYFQFTALTDPWFDIGIRALAQTQAIAGESVIAVLQAPIDQIAVVVNAAADQIRRVGATHCLLRAAGFNPTTAGRSDVRDYLLAVHAMFAHGLLPIPDMVGRFGLCTLHMGAAAFTSGPWHYQRVPADPLAEDAQPGEPAFWEHAGDWDATPLEPFLDSARQVGLPACEPACDAELQRRLAHPKGHAKPLAVCRPHLIHLFRREATRLSALSAAALARELLADQNPQARIWGAALTDARRQTAAQSGNAMP